MGLIRKVSTRSLFMGRLMRGDDLLEAITLICREYDIRFGRLDAIGAVEKAWLGYYDHLAPGNMVFACEIVIEEFDGPPFRREFDNETGLALWQE
jgi:uncharacterized protein